MKKEISGFEKRRMKKKEDIFDAAEALFKQYGYSKTSIAEIAKKASVSQVSIYNFFESKENLREELVSKLLAEHYQGLFEILSAELSIRDKLERLLKARIEFFKSFTVHLFFEGPAIDSFKTNHVHSYYDKFTIEFIELIKNGQKDGVLNSGYSTETILALFDMFEYYFTNNPAASEKFKNNADFAKEFMTLFFSGLVNTELTMGSV